MLDRELRIGACSTLLVLAWLVSFTLLLVCWLAPSTEQRIGAGFTALTFAAFGAALLVIRDNSRTRRVVRAVMRETQPVRTLRSE